MSKVCRTSSASSSSSSSVPSVLAGPAAVEQRLREKKAQAAASMSVADFLREADVEKYSMLFEEREIDSIDKMMRLSDSDLKEMGVKLMGPRRKLTSAIARHRKKMGLAEDDEDTD